MDEALKGDCAETRHHAPFVCWSAAGPGCPSAKRLCVSRAARGPYCSLARRAEDCPRRRHFEKLYDILGALPPPGGPAAAELPTLESRREALAAPVVDWAAMPAACDPCRGGSLGGDTSGAERTAGGNGLEDPREVLQDDGPGTPLRGRNKRWQVRCLPASLMAAPLLRRRVE